MRVLHLAWLLVGMVSVNAQVDTAPKVHKGEGLSDVDRDALLSKLNAIKDASDAKIDARFAVAIGAFNGALQSEEAALAFYIQCTEKISFIDEHKKNREFREWLKAKEAEFSKTSFRRALRVQLQWLILTLKAASERTERKTLVGPAQQIVDAVVNGSAGLDSPEAQAILGQSVLSSVFAKTYRLEDVKTKKWPLAPGNIVQIYEQIILPPVRTPKTLMQLRASWLNRIEQEIKLKEVTTGGTGGGEKGPDGKPVKRTIGMAEDMKSSEFKKFVAVEVPNLQWKMEVDLFQSGDEKAASVRMLNHIQQHLSFPAATEWTIQFQKLLTEQETPEKNNPKGEKNNPKGLEKTEQEIPMERE